MSDLKPCPFCDGELEFRKTDLVEGFCCTDITCGAVITFAGLDDYGAVDPFKAINRRVEPKGST